MKIVALDFETANENPRSACALGIAIYEDGEIIDNFEWLLKPRERYNNFTLSYIHGLCEEDIQNEEEFPFYYERLKEILDGAIIVAHNANFDINVLNSICDLYELERFNNYYIDTVKISRKAFPELHSHRLNVICEYLNIDLKHHDALSDSMACLLILLQVMDNYSTFDIYELMEKLHLSMKKNK